MALDLDEIYRLARRRAYWSGRWEDVAQTAVRMGLERPDTFPGLLVIDAMRVEFGRPRRGVTTHRAIACALPLDHPEWIAGRYATEAELVERWQDEETEDQADEWRMLPAAERDSRRIEAQRALGCLEGWA